MGSFRVSALLAALILALPANAASKIPVAGPAKTDRLNGDQAELFVTVLQEAGYRAKLANSEDGSRYIDSAANGVSFTVNFTDCKPQSGCGGIRFVAWWSKPAYVDHAIVNEWNSGYKLARAAIDKDGDLVLDYYISLVGGVERANFLDSFDWWTVLLADFRGFLDDKENASAKIKREDKKGVAAADEDVAG